MVLLCTLMMIIIGCLLMTSLLTTLSIYTRAAQALERKQRILQRLEKLSEAYLLRTIEPANSDCMLTQDNPNSSIDYILRHQGCVITSQNKSYYYVLSDLGVFSCQKINVNEVQYASHHWLFTLASLDIKPVVLQLHLAIPVPDRRCETGFIQVIPSGVLSWRSLG